MHRDRFMAAKTKCVARRRLRIQRNHLQDTLAKIRQYPWIYTNAAVTAEAAAHWAFIVMPSLRVNDANMDGNN